MTPTYTTVQKVEVGKILKCSYANPVCNVLVKNTVKLKNDEIYYYKLNKLFTTGMYFRNVIYSCDGTS